MPSSNLLQSSRYVTVATCNNVPFMNPWSHRQFDLPIYFVGDVVDVLFAGKMGSETSDGSADAACRGGVFAVNGLHEPDMGNLVSVHCKRSDCRSVSERLCVRCSPLI